MMVDIIEEEPIKYMFVDVIILCMVLAISIGFTYPLLS